MNKTQFLRDQLDKPPEDSKKWKMAMYGLKGVGASFVVGVMMIAFFPSTGAHVTTIVQIFMTAWGGIVGIYLGAQGSVEFKTTSALQTSQDNRPIERTASVEEESLEVHKEARLDAQEKARNEKNS